MKDDGLLPIGVAFRGYYILRRIGTGGSGEVYLARHEVMGAVYAIKVISQRKVDGDAEYRARFFREVRIAARLRHPSLVTVYDAGFDEVTGLYFVAMDYLPGGTIAEDLSRSRRFSIKKALNVARAVAEGLAVIDDAGVVHRDVNPSNMLIAADGSVKLSDYGIARSATDVRTITVTGFALGTPAYMPFEQIVDSHAVDIRADIYALGISLYEMLTGVLPDGDLPVNQLLKKRVDGTRIPDIRTVNSAIPDKLAELVARMIEPDVKDRVRSPRELVELLGQMIETRRPKRPSFVPVRRNRETSPVLIGALVGAMLMLGVLGLIFEDEIVRRLGSSTKEPVAEPKETVHELQLPVAKQPEVREVIREVTNEIVRTVVVTNFVTREEPPVRASENPVQPLVPVPEEFILTNVVEDVVVCGPSTEEEEIRGVSRLIARMADVIRTAYGLSPDRRVQNRVNTVVLSASDDPSVFDAETKTLRVGAAYGNFPVDNEKMVRLCAGFMSTYSEGLNDFYNVLVNRYVRILAIKELNRECGQRDLKRACAKSPEMRILRLVDEKDGLANYFRVRRDVYRSGMLTLPMTKHDFAAMLSLACGGSVFPHLRRHGLAVDEYATKVRIRKLPPADFFGE